MHVCSYPDREITNLLKGKNKIILGNLNAFNKIRKSKLDYYYDYLFFSNCLFSNYPKSLEANKIKDKVNYIHKQLTGKKVKLSGSPRKQFLDCCDLLDRIGK